MNCGFFVIPVRAALGAALQCGGFQGLKRVSRAQAGFKRTAAVMAPVPLADHAAAAAPYGSKLSARNAAATAGGASSAAALLPPPATAAVVLLLPLLLPLPEIVPLSELLVMAPMALLALLPRAGSASAAAGSGSNAARRDALPAVAAGMPSETRREVAAVAPSSCAAICKGRRSGRCLVSPL